MSIQLGTMERGSPFEFTGTTSTGTVITYGATKATTKVDAADWASILARFRGKTVPLGAHFDPAERAPGSLGEFLLAITKTSIATYVAAIMVHEGLARAVQPPAGAPVAGVWIEVFP